MNDRDSGRSCPSIGSIASSKSVCGKRLVGWIILFVIVGTMALGIAATVNSRNQRYTETQYEIGVAANQWTETYKDETESWTPSVIMESGSEYAVSESNSADFTGRYQSLNNYDVVKFYNENIKSLIANQTDVFLIENPDNGEFNITTPMVIEFSTGDMLELNDIPFFSKMRSPRSQKDCTLNRAGIWNTTDNVGYVYKQLTHLCLIIDHNKFPNLTSDYRTFPCDEINRSYASFAAYSWTDPNTNPTFNQFSSHYDMSLTIRSSKDPYVVGYTTVDILKEKEDNTMFLWGLLLGIVGIFSLIIPVKLINTEDEFAPTPSREKARFMQYRA